VLAASGASSAGIGGERLGSVRLSQVQAGRAGIAGGERQWPAAGARVDVALGGARAGRWGGDGAQADGARLKRWARERLQQAAGVGASASAAQEVAQAGEEARGVEANAGAAVRLVDTSAGTR
jgi:hypothetical protein